MKKTTLCMQRDVHINRVKGPVMKGRECHVTQFDWVNQVPKVCYFNTLRMDDEDPPLCVSSMADG
jgi:hypothetical protein